MNNAWMADAVRFFRQTDAARQRIGPVSTGVSTGASTAARP